MRKLKTGELYLCHCPDWNYSGYQVAKWDGKKFDYEDATNDEFDSYVKGFIQLKENEIDFKTYERT